MLKLRHYEELTELMLRVPQLVRGQQERTATFTTSVAEWMLAVENSLNAGRRSQAGTVAALRSSLIAIERGQEPEGINFRGRSSSTRARAAAASRALGQATAIVSSLLEQYQPRFDEATRIAQQIVAAAYSRNMVLPRTAELGNTEYLRLLRRSFRSASDLEGACVALEGITGPTDMLVFLDRALAPYEVRNPFGASES